MNFRYVIVLLVLSYTQLLAQKVELGVHAGLANYTGDVAQNIVLGETNFSAGAFARYNVNHTWAFTGIITQLKISGSDQNFDYNRARNITFQTNITDFSGLVEFNYFKYGPGVTDKHFTPYVYWGLGVAFFNPKGLYKSRWYDLKELRTEGVAYSGVTAVMPLGIGVKWMPNKNMSLECSFGFRKTYTDYLDDVSNKYIDPTKQLNERGQIAATLADPSILLNEGYYSNKEGYQRGNPDFNDFYFIGNVSVTYRIFTRIKCSRFY